MISDALAAVSLLLTEFMTSEVLDRTVSAACLMELIVMVAKS